MSSIKLEPTVKVAPLNGTQAVSKPPPADLPTVKCELTLSESCACADGKCDDCQEAADKEDEKDNILTTLSAAVLPLSRPENDESEFHPPIWEDCEAAEDTGSSGEEIKEDSTDHVEAGTANYEAEMSQDEANQMAVNVGSSPIAFSPSTRAREVEEMMVEGESEVNSNPPSSMLSQAIPEQRNEEVIASYEGNRSGGTEPEEEEEEAGPAEATVSSLSLRRSTRVRKSAVNYAILPEAEEEAPPDEPNTDTSDGEESDSDETESETDSETEMDEASETARCYQIAADGDGSLSQRSFPCRYCKKKFSFKQNARRHEDTLHHQIEKSPPYSCCVADCGKTFLTKVALEVHSFIHSGLRPFTCKACGVAFNNKSNLERHQGTHKDARPYACGVCGKGFKSKSNIARHNLTHSGLKPFTCVDCGVSFRLKLTLKRHCKGKIACASRYTPSESRPFSCTVAGCGRAFKSRDNLNAHAHTHSGAKAFKCSVCEGAFTRKSSLKRHSRTVHRTLKG